VAIGLSGFGRRFGHSERSGKPTILIFLSCIFLMVKPKQENAGEENKIRSRLSHLHPLHRRPRTYNISVSPPVIFGNVNPFKRQMTNDK
jgi:hypothetical protein